jgi:hypothetical protein
MIGMIVITETSCTRPVSLLTVLHAGTWQLSLASADANSGCVCLLEIRLSDVHKHARASISKERVLRFDLHLSFYRTYRKLDTSARPKHSDSPSLRIAQVVNIPYTASSISRAQAR